MSFGLIAFTNRGKALQAKAQAGTQLNFTRIAVGDGQLSGQAIADLTALIHEVKSITLNKFKTLPGGKAVVGGVLSNQDLQTGFWWRELGLFAQDPDLGEILYCYGNAGELAEYIPSPGGAQILEKQVDIISIIGNAQNVSAEIDQSLIYATIQDVNNLRDELNEHKAEFESHKAEFESHKNDDTRHVSQTEKDIWNSKAEGNHNHDSRYVQTRVYNGALQYYDGGWKDVAVSPIKSIQRGTHAGGASDDDITITINTVNPAKCIVILNSSITAHPNSTVYAPILKNITSNSLVVSKSRMGSQTEVPFSWQVIEYN